MCFVNRCDLTDIGKIVYHIAHRQYAPTSWASARNPRPIPGPQPLPTSLKFGPELLSPAESRRRPLRH
eukprot:1860198-Rhodomonas_salina.1